MQTFNSNNVESRFIKNLLKNIYIPNVPTVSLGDFIVEGVTYCLENHIIRCTRSGILSYSGIINGIIYINNCPTAGDNCICGPDFICGRGPSSADYEVITEIDYNSSNVGLTVNYVSHSDLYDIDTHKYLGKYLRYYRDVRHIDLMFMYNCFCGESTSSFYIKGNKIIDGVNDDYYVWLVPAYLNKNYTLYIDSNDKVSICGVLCNKYGRIKFNNSNTKFKYIDESMDNVVRHYDSSSYANPIHYSLMTTDKKILSFSNNFYIMIQTTSKNTPSIVVLEGDYEHRYHRVITNSYTDDEINYSLFNPIIWPSITRMPTSTVIPYSSHLIEYLTENSITSDEDIPNNIRRVQKVLIEEGYKIKDNDIWTDKLKYCIYNNYFKYNHKHYLKSSQLNSEGYPNDVSNIPDKFLVKDENRVVGLKNCKSSPVFDYPYDISGFVDKEVENSLFNYRSV